MSEQEFDFHSVGVMEPSGKLYFPTRKSLFDHVIKHVVENYKEEKWRLLDGFNASTIREVDMENPESSGLGLLVHEYITLIRETVIQACAEGKDHLHQVAFYPSKMMELFRIDDPEPVQYVKILDFSKKLFIILSSDVRNGVSRPYIIRTAYRVFPDLKLHSWKKLMKNRLDEMSDIRKGKKFVLIADHMEPEKNNEKEMES